MTMNIRQRRQTTLPSELLEKLGLSEGDSLAVEIKNQKAILTPKRQVALDAFRELQRMFQDSGIPLKEMLDEVDRERTKRAREDVA